MSSSSTKLSKSPPGKEQQPAKPRLKAAQPIAPSGARPVPAAQPIPVGKSGATPATVRAQQSMTARAQGKDAASEEEEDADELSESPFQDWLYHNCSWITSAMVHALILLIMGLLVIENKKEIENIVESAIVRDETPEELPEFDVPIEDEAPYPDLDVPPEAPESDMPVIDNMEEGAEMSMLEDINSLEHSRISDSALQGIGGAGNSGSGTGMGGRGKRRAGAGGKGATPKSEEAVELALKWLAEHQQPDGSWNFDHRKGPCQGRCPDPGNGTQSINGATGLAILPFLGAGYTHYQGKYKKTVSSGLQYLIGSQQNTPNGGSWLEPQGSMYAHGIATLAICEAYAMALQARENADEIVSPSEGGKKEDPRAIQRAAGQGLGAMAAAAQAGLYFIAYAQDDAGGGWRYAPKMPGDTSVVGWQVMALKSGHLSRLQINPATVLGANKFLDSVSSESGSRYGYTDAGAGTAATTAVGLLCRMYMGWKKDNAGLQLGQSLLSQQGPAPNNMYYNYYATQVMFHMTGGEGDVWKKWNDKMRDSLVNTQAKEGHTAGSWMFNDGHASGVGGRLYSTAMACMTLEVYYRFMPIYGSKSVDKDLDEAELDK